MTKICIHHSSDIEVKDLDLPSYAVAFGAHPFGDKEWRVECLDREEAQFLLKRLNKIHGVYAHERLDD